MKSVLSALLMTLAFGLQAQIDSSLVAKDSLMYRIYKTDGGELTGRILSQDEREVFFQTKDGRKIYIPQHTIEEMVPLNPRDFNQEGLYVGEDRFATRYFFTTNGLPIKKGEHYVQWNLFGPDFQFSLGNNIGVGFITSWFGTPLIGNVKKTWEVNEGLHLGVGSLIGTLSWVSAETGGILPFGSLSLGNRSQNLSFSAGYGSIWTETGRSGSALASVGGITKLSPKFSLVLDSFIIIPEANNAGGALIIPGLRWHQGKGKAFQFGLVAIVGPEGAFPVPIPMVQWFRAL